MTCSCEIIFNPRSLLSCLSRRHYDEAWKGTCAALASCPINSMKSSVPMSMDCVCAPEYNGYVDYYGHNNTYVSTCTRLVCDLATQQMKTEYNAGHYHSYCECQTGKTQTWSAGTNSPTMTCA
jgi:hypothetical protein